MGTSAILVPVDDFTLQRLRQHPGDAEEILYPDEDEDGLTRDSFSPDKAWHGLHYLLTGTSDGGESPLAWAIFGDEQLDDADIGMGGASVLTPPQVREVAAALAALSPKELRRRYDPQRMTTLKIYPDVIWARDGQDALDWAMTQFEPLVRFYADTAARGDAVFIYMS
jgi:hypothetical protein